MLREDSFAYSISLLVIFVDTMGVQVGYNQLKTF